MAHFFGRLQGARGEATRLGSEKSGVGTVAASWQGAIRVELYASGKVDMARVIMIPWHGAGISRVLYEGPVGGKKGWVASERRTERERLAEHRRRMPEPPVTETEDAGSEDALVPVAGADDERWAEYNRKFNALLMGGS